MAYTRKPNLDINSPWPWTNPPASEFTIPLIKPALREGVISVDLTKREYFAAAALQGLLAASSGSQPCINTGKFAVQWADKTLKALRELPPQDS